MNTHQNNIPGSLYIVATPIGNRDDMSKRAIDILNSVDMIFAEDTRHSSQLLSYFGISKPLLSLHAHNENEKAHFVIQELLHQKSIAIISDAGTPLINDPGFPVVRLAREQNISVIPIPGPSALITALSAAGVPCDSFLFLGFLPPKQSARLERLRSVRTSSYTIVFYESTHRVLQSLKDIETVFGSDCSIVLAKELTKSFERFINNNVSSVIAWLEADKNHVKGEFVLIIPPHASDSETTPYENILGVLLEELPLKQAVSIAAKITHVSRNTLYQHALLIQSQK